MAVESFKGYDRGPRVQVPEELYNKGMQYTNAPLDEGLCRLMVNYDLKDGGKLIVPRPGLVINLITSGDADYVDVLPDYTTSMHLFTARECVEEDSNTYRQMILGNTLSNELYVYSVKPTTPDKAWITLISESAKFLNSPTAEIHNIPMTDLAHMVRHIGTFAFNNTYYYFDSDGLQHTKFVPGTTPPAHYFAEAVTPKILTPAEAVMWGYNMLLPNPYQFNNTLLGAAAPIYLDGVLPYDADNNLALSPQVNQALHFECFYRAYATKVYEVKWEWKEPGGSAWTELKKETLTIDTGVRFKCDFNVPNNAVMLRVTATNTTDAADLQVMTIGFDFSKTTQGSAANSQQNIYDLKQATSMAFWKNRLVLACKNLLFMSEINDPGYFPYPNNMEPFDEDIIHVVPYLDNLLVFTSSKLYSITLSEDGLSWTVKNIQGNLTIKEHEIHLIQIVKNMVFFKSGNYYYMVVPKASSMTGELTIAPVSKPIEPLLDNFKPVIAKILELLYNYTDTLELKYYHNFLDFEDVHNVYTFQTTLGTTNPFVNIDLLYNTVLRTWRVYIYESGSIIKPFKQDATTKGTFMALTQTAVGSYPIGKPSVYFLKFNGTDCKDERTVELNYPITIYFKNYQLLDTGHRDISSNLKKRFREAQLKLNNLSGKTLDFYTEFTIDGDTRTALYRYVPHHEIDPLNPNYGFLTMERELVDPSILPGTTILGETETDYNCWALDISQFPDTSLWKIRVPFSGKGYCPRMLLVSFNEEPYELLNNIWVFRQLYSR